MSDDTEDTGERSVVLLPALPAEMGGLDVIARTSRGFAVRVSPQERTALEEAGVPFAPMFDSSGDYVAAVSGASRDQAVAALEQAQTTAIAALDPGVRDAFGLA
jgi:hypothetical protein